MKIAITTFFAMLALSGIAAENLPLQREGTKVSLSASEIADLKQWVENAKHDLSILQDDLRRGSLEERRSAFIRDFEGIVKKSGTKENELLMRYTLNRALEIDQIVGPNPQPNELQSLVAFLDSTIELSKGFYTDDLKYLEAIGRGEEPALQIPMPVFAFEYAEMIFGISRTLLRPQLEYQVSLMALGWLGNDLNSPRNLSRIQHSEEIYRISRLQGQFPMEAVGNDQTILAQIRKLKFEYRERIQKSLITKSPAIQESIARFRSRTTGPLALKKRETPKNAALPADHPSNAGSLSASLSADAELRSRIARRENSPEDVQSGLDAALSLAKQHQVSLSKAVDYYVVILKAAGDNQTSYALASYRWIQTTVFGLALKRGDDPLTLFESFALLVDFEGSAAHAQALMEAFEKVYQHSTSNYLSLTRSFLPLAKHCTHNTTKELELLLGLADEFVGLKDDFADLMNLMLATVKLDQITDGVGNVGLVLAAVKKGHDLQDSFTAFNRILKENGNGGTASARQQFETLMEKR
jgi:hypothetical protein